MDYAERKADFGAWLRRTWTAAMRVADAMERSPIDDIFDRLDRLEREMAALRNRKGTAIDGPMQKHIRTT
jgi:hypothetical protein